MDTNLGTLIGAPVPGKIGIDPASEAVKQGFDTGQIKQIVILAEPTEAVAVSRMLVKMGLETIAKHSTKEALNPRYDAARVFARSPRRGSTWWFLVHTDHPALFSKFVSGVSLHEWLTNVGLAVIDMQGIMTFELQLLDMTIITPLDGNVLPPPMAGMAEPEYRLFQIKT